MIAFVVVAAGCGALLGGSGAGPGTAGGLGAACTALVGVILVALASGCRVLLAGASPGAAALLVVVAGGHRLVLSVARFRRLACAGDQRANGALGKV